MLADTRDSAFIDTPANIGWRWKLWFAQKHQKKVIFTMGMAFWLNKTMFKTAQTIKELP